MQGNRSIDANILAALRANPGAAVSGAELSQKLKVSRAAIWARIEELRSLGYDIEASPHTGYRLLSAPDLLHADDLVSRLASTQVVGRDIRVFEETTSTNDVVEKLARDGAGEGVVVFAESQTRGRGRLGRHWTSPRGKGLWFSILLRPNLHPLQITQLTVISATALRRAIHDLTGLAPQIKWPNDIMLNGKKAAGILTEMQAELDRVRHVIVGIGVDVNLNLTDFPVEFRQAATSIKAELGRAVSRPDLAVSILRALDADYERLGRGEFARAAEEWEEHSATLGTQIIIRVGNREIRGRAESLDDAGALLVRTDHGHIERIIGGDITLECPQP